MRISSSHRCRGVAVIGAGLAVATTLTACGKSSTTSPDASSGSSGSPTSGAQSACITSFDASKDYFPGKVQPTDAKGFAVEYHNSYKVVSVPATDASAAEKYVLVQCGAPRPTLSGDLAKAQVITIPVQRVGSASSTQVADLDLLKEIPALVASDDPSDLVDPAAAALAKAGKIQSFGTASGGIDAEKVLSAKPDVVFEGGFPDPAWTKVRSLGIPTVAEGGWLEASPLGRAEWLKYYATFFDEEATANTQYQKISGDYASVKQQVASAKDQPSVLVGTEFKGKWTVPAKDSYVASLVADAGGNYVFKDASGANSAKIDAETVLTKGANAKFWLNGNWMSKTHWKTRADMLAADPRVSALAAVKSGEVWNPTKRVTANGNDYWESGVVRPDRVLADMAMIFHPELFPGKTPYYYTKLGA